MKKIINEKFCFESVGYYLVEKKKNRFKEKK